jgi:hypothetical protein
MKSPTGQNFQYYQTWEVYTYMSEKGLIETDFPNLKLASRGKVRDIYDLANNCSS